MPNFEFDGPNMRLRVTITSSSLGQAGQTGIGGLGGSRCQYEANAPLAENLSQSTAESGSNRRMLGEVMGEENWKIK